MIASY